MYIIRSMHYNMYQKINIASSSSVTPRWYGKLPRYKRLQP